MKPGQTTDLEALLLHERWVQRLARALVGENDDAAALEPQTVRFLHEVARRQL